MRLELSFCKFIFVIILILMIFCTTLLSYFYVATPISRRSIKKLEEHQISFTRLVLSLVACETRFEESLNVVKSALTFTQNPIHFVIFTDDTLHSKFEKTLNEWRRISNYQLSFELMKIKFPEKHKTIWENLFQKCAAQRLFIPELIPHIDSIIYVDTDTLFLGPMDELWALFSQFNSTQMCALVIEDERSNVSWYPRFAKHPFYGQLGLNSGVMLMNLTRMREAGWDQYVTPIMLKYKLYIPWGDQDIINVILHYHPEWVLEMSCRFNYRPDQCRYGDACSDATRNGVVVMHGSRHAFHSEQHGAFAAIYKAMDEHQLTSNQTDLVNRIDTYISDVSTPKDVDCTSFKDAFLKVPKQNLANKTAGLRIPLII